MPRSNRLLPLHEAEGRALADILAGDQPRDIQLTGPRGVGKTTLIEIMRDGHAGLGLHPHPTPLLHLMAEVPSERILLDGFETEALDTLGPLPRADRPDVLPRGGLGLAWVRVLEGILLALGQRSASGRPAPVLVLDGMENLRAARRSLPGELAEILRRTRARAHPVHLVRVGRTLAEHGPWQEALEAEGVVASESADRSRAGTGLDATVDIRLRPPGFRAGGWVQLGGGGQAPPSESGGRHRAAFRFWAVFGSDPAHFSLSGSRAQMPEETGEDPLRAAVIRRILTPGGDLHHIPLRRLELEVQSPGRYATLLKAVSVGVDQWGDLAAELGQSAGNRIAPYLSRLEEAGLLEVQRPLGADPRGRRRRYLPVDPFLALWFGHILPHLSALRRLGPDTFFDRILQPALDEHLGRWFQVAARQWMATHAEEAFGTGARESGALWGGEAELDVAARLAGGQVCYGVVQRNDEGAGEALMARLDDAMRRTRYGLGREARAPIYFLHGTPDEALRRRVARDPLARIVSWRELMGSDPFSSSPFGP